jgi:hypothetical protein
VKPLPSAKVPCGHGKQPVEPAFAIKVPGSHIVHFVAPYWFIHDPGGQIEGVYEPVAKTKKPGGAGKQKLLFVAAANELKVPGEHAIQLICCTVF